MRALISHFSQLGQTFTNNVIKFSGAKDSFQVYVDTYIASEGSNFSDFLKKEGFLLDSLSCESTSANSNFEDAIQDPRKVTASYTIEGEKINIIATKLPSIKDKVAETLNFIAEPRHSHCDNNEAETVRK